MIKKTLIGAIILICLMQTAHAEGVKYYKGTVYEALSYAQSQHKMLMVEFYAKWNYRSRWMNENVIARKEIYTKLDESFVIVLVDTETKDGAKLAEAYQVKNYPSFVVFNLNGNVVDKIEQTLDREDFVTRLAQIIIENDGKSSWELRKIYTAIQNNNPILADNLAREYLERIGTEKAITPYHWELFSNSTLSSFGTYVFGFILENRSEFDSVYKKIKVDELINNSLFGAVMPYAIGAFEYDSIHIDSLRRTVARSKTVHEETLGRLSEIAEYRKTNQIDKLIITISDVLSDLDDRTVTQLIMSTEFIATHGTNEQKIHARNLIKKHRGNMTSQSDLMLLERLDKKFTE